MKKINLNNVLKSQGIDIDRWEVLGMEFIKQKDGNYIIKDSNGVIVSEKEKLQLENNELIIKDVESNNCQKENAKKIKKNKKRIEELEKVDDVIEVIEETKSIKE